MLKKNANREVKLERLNLIPIMDAVFIFIFFLLFSAQFIKIYDIESDAPVVSEVPEDKKPEKEPLNLKVKIAGNSITVTKGFNDIKLKEFNFIQEDENFKDLKDFVFNMRSKNPDDQYVIIAPSPEVKYESIVKIIDAVKALPEGMKEWDLTVKGKPKKLTHIFEQIVLEPIE